ncbi:uncharacterized protein RHIMIDRAFT_271316 [Rhizopus microsporus ATCC 52813]|uniref:HSF-type DNA-binding domain-containing protein n=1 Tax=Rhizopus microsporus ATCC 52813 TaxID=1340429 RepID=A0A2G4T266_RHIZD|nr:uncharacterized protein RHIMIDRAFT_271316 [Rhizopus microsporus ATCC 52813]PHZ15097.1 hypothetical protein RHIMIDRAFT_271316 [Rhizopus microsporus ATCC 52813]
MKKPQPQPIQKLRPNEQPLTRKRSHSASSSASSDSPGAFSNTFSDSGSSSMTSNASNHMKRTRSVHNVDPSSSGDSSNTSSSSSAPQTGRNSSSSNNQRLTAQRSVPAFLNKLYNMVSDASTDSLIRWSTDGNSFIVERHEEFAKKVLPRFYKHNTFASFVRQLNMYDFHKIPHLQQGVLISDSNSHEIWEFSNPHFQRGRPDLLILVTRKKNKDRDNMDGDAPSVASLADDLALIKKHQETIGNQLKELHRDNEILWQETLNSREKYHRHQEAIEKILLFLTAVFTNNDQLALPMGSNGTDVLLKGLIEEAASLAGITIDQDKLYSINQSDQLPQQIKPNIDFTPTVAPSSIEELKPPSLADFSQTLNTATRSAQSITQDISMLQMNIESLANNLGIDPNQFDEDMETDQMPANYAWNPESYDIANDSIIIQKEPEEIITPPGMAAAIPPKFNLQFPGAGHPEEQQRNKSSQQIFQTQASKSQLKPQEKYIPQRTAYPISADNHTSSVTDIKSMNIGYQQFISSMNALNSHYSNTNDIPGYISAPTTSAAGTSTGVSPVTNDPHRTVNTRYFANDVNTIDQQTITPVQPQPQHQQPRQLDTYGFVNLQNNYASNIPEQPFYNKR